MDVDARVISKVKLRLLPFLMVLYIINNIDRLNISFAALGMNKELGISTIEYGTLTAAFFIFYFFLEVPSNIAQTRYGANKWMCRIMVSWGIVTCLFFFVNKFWHVYALRLMLGAFEAGFFPGIIYYMTFWFPAKERAQATSLFMMAFPICNIIGAPLATLIMDNVQWLGYSGWRWLFMFEGIPAIILGVVCWFYLTNKPQDAKWLTQEERDWLTAKIQRETVANQGHRRMSFKDGFKHPKAWWVGMIYFTICIASYSSTGWMPQIVKSFSAGMTNTTVGYIMMLPAIFGAIGLIFWSRHSDKTGERKWHVALPALVMAFGFVIIMVSTSLTWKVIGVVLQGAAISCFLGPFWSLPAIFLSNDGAAVGIAIINTLSSLAGFIGSLAVGLVKENFGLNAVFMYQIAMCVTSALLVIALPLKDKALHSDLKAKSKQV